MEKQLRDHVIKSQPQDGKCGNLVEEGAVWRLGGQTVNPTKCSALQRNAVIFMYFLYAEFKRLTF